jgi:hypothetical protein
LDARRDDLTDKEAEEQRRPEVQKEPVPRSHPSGGAGAGTAGGSTGEVPQGGAIGPGPATGG